MFNSKNVNIMVMVLVLVAPVETCIICRGERAMVSSHYAGTSFGFFAGMRPSEFDTW